MAVRYRQFLKLCELWKIDKTKHGRDLGEHIRQKVAQFFKDGEGTRIMNEKECEDYYNSLCRLVENSYRKKYRNRKLFSASGLTGEECQKVLSTDQMAALKVSETRVIQKLLLRFGKMPVKA